eukprot:3183924-Rhodomonas_salina.1
MRNSMQSALASFTASWSKKCFSTPLLPDLSRSTPPNPSTSPAPSCSRLPERPESEPFARYFLAVYSLPSFLGFSEMYSLTSAPTTSVPFGSRTVTGISTSPVISTSTAKCRQHQQASPQSTSVLLKNHTPGYLSRLKWVSGSISVVAVNVPTAFALYSTSIPRGSQRRCFGSEASTTHPIAISTRLQQAMACWVPMWLQVILVL